ncbi:transcriptional regulator, MarR family [Beutenbergia cavernae DSM 12333]|uniref:Transcriptional regulator, MarR family n=1 Tax=Beutenbergia cavernae (strain ATCC BAA-8 / DSM 12333 / CCUG 43141 / JCM 11478 / NBRC 16432 / NCIMB 13614 / HKI 0122) TaxID=471853 RepID=C5C189_BEUC1|nr:MarR family transcriptional regulator [Beutenbergia cavernae]ACQ81499.1 transcriptional regulator, MarR family [Beutenbergia cavernae DSM 12333]
MSDTAAHQEDVRWLDADQQRSWRAYIAGTTYLMAALSHDLETATGLSMPEYEVLVRLSEAPGRTLRMSSLANGLVHSRSRMTHTITRMERAGLVERARCGDDGRGVFATMTPAGWDRLVAAAPIHVASVRDRLVDAVTPDQMEALGEAMAAVARAGGVDEDAIGTGYV